ncbi:hypothetical protein Ahy_B04g070345 [Arachis hypogaea]|uniref:Uncharacterized protein n=1 Tax=Arachis hypogaea TaxID=3818 RepID=A0A444ZGI0_ARAHY|nr:hypothetical protein Ahy_B04g070345 [Arachis hypogaea]
MAKEIESLTEDERRALRGSKFAPLPSLPRSSSQLAHPGGPLATNKAAALAKFLERKLKEPNGLASINPDLLELAVNNAKRTVYASNNKSITLTMQLIFLLFSSCNLFWFMKISFPFFFISKPPYENVLLVSLVFLWT